MRPRHATLIRRTAFAVAAGLAVAALPAHAAFEAGAPPIGSAAAQPARLFAGVTQVELRALLVQFKGRTLPERIDAYQNGYQVLLPLGELSRLLGYDIRVDAPHGLASGTVRGADQRFALDLGQSLATVGGREQGFEPRLAMVIGDEIYLSTQLIARWLPVELAVDLPTWQLRVQPREAAPVAAVPLVPLAPPPPGPTATSPVGPLPLPPARRAADVDANLLVLEVQLDGQVLSDSFAAYQDGKQLLLPLGELARLLTLAIEVHPELGSANGYLVTPERGFALNLGQDLVSLAGRESGFEPRLASVIGDDIYVSSQLLQHWLPLNLKLDLATLQLKVEPREKLPLQERLERERLAAGINAHRAAERPVYPYQASTPGPIGLPFVDQTYGASERAGQGQRRYQGAYTAYLTGDLLWMEGAAYATRANEQATPDLRMTLSRHDPDAALLGPLHASAVAVGNVVLPSVRNVMQGSPMGNGVAVSNRPLDQPNSFDRHSFRGDLPPGWDVTLYYNEALVGFQSSRADGQYNFDDMPLSFGRNDFRLVFHGPLGQLRVEKQSFLLDQASVKPGQVYYSVAQQYDPHGTPRSVAQADIGLTRTLTGEVGLVRRPRTGTLEPLTFGQIGLLAYMNDMILSSQLDAMGGGGALGELGLKTRVAGFSVDLLHTQRGGNFDNDQYSDVAGNVRLRDELSLNGLLHAPGLPVVNVAVDAVRNGFDQGPSNVQIGLRTSTVVRGTALSNSLRWQRSGDVGTTDGVFQISRRVADVGLNAQLGYEVQPLHSLQSIALTADHGLAGGYQLSGGVLRTLDSGLTLFSGGVSRNFGSFGLAVNASYSSQHDAAVGMQLFVALGRDPRTGKWSLDGLPLAGTGAVSARAFVDKNMNGIHDPGEEYVENAGFIVNGGGRHPVLTDANGTALLSRLAPDRYADLALDPDTLEDPQWKPLTPGVRVLPRPGRVELVEFPVVPTSEVEGTVWIVEAKGRRRGIGAADVELVNLQGEVVARCTSASDGYYLLHQVMPGRYHIRIAPEQAKRLKLAGALDRSLDIEPDGNFVSGEDLEFRVAAAR
ncbi:MAG: hypothetical protein JO224_00435 [Pelomonas sp.]|nr:hypothetical protein [Roseateles sp.]